MQNVRDGSPLKLGLIGCGIAAHDLHWPALRQMPDRFRVTALCNRTLAKAEALADLIESEGRQKVAVVANVHELLSMEELDAVSILLPIEWNKVVAPAAAAAGKHVLMEKPLAESLDHAAALCRLEEEYPDLVMMVGENFRYRPAARALARVIREGRIGTPYHVECRSWQWVAPETSKYARTSWRINHAYEGGFVSDGGVHFIAQLRSIVGDLEILGATSSSVNPGIGRTDTLTALFRTEAQQELPSLTGVLALGFSVHGMQEDSIRILGSSGSAKIERGVLAVYGDTPEDVVLQEDHPDDGGFSAEYEDFHRAITTGSTPASTVRKAYGDLETVLTALDLCNRNDGAGILRAHR